MKKIFTAIIFLALLLPYAMGIFAFSTRAATVADSAWYDENATTLDIYDAADLAAFAEKLAAQDTEKKYFEGVTVNLKADVDLNPTWDGDKDTFPSDGYKWPEMTYADVFGGTFNGNGYTISGVYRSTTKAQVGMFGVSGANASGDLLTTTLRDFTIEGSYFYSACWQPCALIGVASGEKLIIENVDVAQDVLYECTTSSSAFYVGYTGYNKSTSVEIKNCIFYGTCRLTNPNTSTSRGIAAFIGEGTAGTDTNHLIDSCAMYGTIEGPGDVDAGIAVDILAAGTATISNCIVSGDITANTNGNINYICTTSKGTYTAMNNIIVHDSSKGNIAEKSATGSTVVNSVDSLTGASAQEVLNTAGIKSFVASATGLPVLRNTTRERTVTNAKTLYKGYQLKENKSNATVDIRLVGVTSIGMNDLASYKSVGFTFVGYFVDPEATGNVNIHSAGKTTVYTSILSDGDDWSVEPELGEQFIFVQEITGVPIYCGDIALEISTFYEQDSKIMEGTEMVRIQMEATPETTPVPVGTELYDSALPLRTGESMAYTVTPDEYTNYVNALNATFGTAVQSSEVGGNSFATYIRGSKQVNTSYYPSINKLIVMETASGYIPSSDGALASGTVTQIAISGVGMSYVTKMADGKFIIIDGGLDEGTNTADLWDYLDTNTTGTAKPQITWIFTHSHPDHVALATSFVNQYASQIVVDAVGYNFSSAEVSLANGEAMLSAFMTNAPSAKVWIMHAGQVANIYGCKLTVLSTHEEISTDGVALAEPNSASLAFMMELENGRMLILGDMTGIGAANLANNFNATALKADVLQAAHHGVYAADLVYGQKAEYNDILVVLYAKVDPDTVAISNTEDGVSTDSYGVYGSSGYSDATEIFETSTQTVLG